MQEAQEAYYVCIDEGEAFEQEEKEKDGQNRAPLQEVLDSIPIQNNLLNVDRKDVAYAFMVLLVYPILQEARIRDAYDEVCRTLCVSK